MTSVLRGSSLASALFLAGCLTPGRVVTPAFLESRGFCGSCHVMVPYAADAAAPDSQSLAAQHSRVPGGESSCYNCHAAPGALGWVRTKLTGTKHVATLLLFYTGQGEFGERGPPITLNGGFHNRMCTRCHDLGGPAWSAQHGADAPAIRAEELRCVDCHDLVHPRAPAHGGNGRWPLSAARPVP